MASSASERRARIHHLELMRQEKIHHLEMTKRDEESRLLRVRLLKLREENTVLNKYRKIRDTRVTSLTRQVAKLQRELAASTGAMKSRESESTEHNLEIFRLKAEVQSLTARHSDEALRDKLDLQRELDCMRPEMERLRSTLEGFQATVAEKNYLQRKVESLEVELNDERRSKQREQKREDDAKISEMRSQVSMVEKSLSCSREELVKAQRSHERELAEARSFTESLEERIGSLKTKFKASQAELKATRTQLATCRAELETSRGRKGIARGAELEKKNVSLEPQLSYMSRGQERSFGNITMQTPGNEGMLSKQVPDRKHRPIKATVGEKSTFSITPFLNRTKSLSDDSQDAPAHDNSQSDGPDSSLESSRKSHEKIHSTLPRTFPVVEEVPTDVEPQPSAQEQVKSDEKTLNDLVSMAQSRRKNKGLVKTAASRVNEAVTMGDKVCSSKNATTAGPKSSKIAIGQENVEPTADGKKATMQRRVQRVEKTKMKKRKVLGASKSTLLEDEDDEEALDPLDANPVLAPAKRLRTHLGGGIKNAFAGTAFSPLKRDRRGANASLLS